MAKVFVSYSRKDITFAKRLTAELQKCELDFWIDWEGIPPTVDWWKEIEKGIEEADIFLFLISPDSSISKVCGQEIDTAVKNAKRIIPLVVRDISGEKSPKQLSHLNWIFFRDTDDFEAAFQKLLTGIHTDYEWVQHHRWLQVRALDWIRDNRDNSSLLRGKDLQDVEYQLATNSSKEPHPTDLQREYLFASRKATDRQRRIVTSISITGFIVMALLTVFALIQLNISRAQQLGFQAQVAFADENYNTALLYAYQSNLIHKNKAANQVLSQLPYKNFALGKAIYADTLVGDNIAWSPDGQFTSAVEDGTVIIWDLATRQPAKILHSDSYSATSVDWSPAGRLASVSRDGKVIIWDLNTSQPAQVLESDLYSVTNAAWSPAGKLASVSRDGKVIIWDIDTGQPAQVLESDLYSLTDAVWSPDGQLASTSRDGKVIVWDLNTGQPAQILESNNYVANQIAWSPHGQIAAITGGSDNVVIIWDLKKSPTAQILRGHTDTVMTVAWSPHGQLASASQDFRVIIWDLDTSQPAQILKGHNATINHVAWSADEQLASASLDKSVIIWDLATGLPAQTLKGHSGFVNKVIWSPKGQLASLSSDNTAIIWDVDMDQVARTLDAPSAATSTAWSYDGKLASGLRDGTVIIWDLENGQPTQTLIGHTGEVGSIAWSRNRQLASVSITSRKNSQVLDSQIMIWNPTTGRPTQTLNISSAVFSVAWSPGGQLTSGSDKGFVSIWNLETGQPVQTMKAPSAVRSVAWSPDGRLASGSEDGTVIIWNLETHQPAQTLVSSSAVRSVAWSPDGQLASGSEDGTVSIWNLETSQPVETMKAPSAVYSVAWSPNGQLASASWSVPLDSVSLASASGLVESEVIVWNINTGQPAQTLKAHSSSINSITWSPNGQLASASWDQTIKIARKDLVSGDACSHIYRNMTIEEWLNTQGALYTYRPACPNLYDPGRDSLTKGSFRQGFSEFENLGLPKVLSKAATYVLLAIVGPIIAWRDPTLLDVDLRIFLITWKGRAMLLLIYSVFLCALFFILRGIFKTAVWARRKVQKQKAFSMPISEP